jgi:hypothetical protein
MTFAFASTSMKAGRRICAGLLFAAAFPLSSVFAVAQPPKPDATWQFSVPLETGTERRAYLWIPPHCKHVRGVLIGMQNMLERPMFEDPTIRQALAAEDLAIVWVSPGAWPGNNTAAIEPTIAFNPKDAAIAGVQHVLAGLAQESGYSELENAPLLVTGHSAASPFAWGMAQSLPDRVFAALPFKGYPVGPAPAGVPTLKMEQEWGEWGKTWGEVWRKDMHLAAVNASQSPGAMLGDFADLGSGHFDWHHDAAPVVAMFLRKAAERRLPQNAPLTGPVQLKPISIESGVLVDPETLGTAQFKAVPYAEWKGDPKTAFWYFDKEMAEAIQQNMLLRLNRKPEMIDFIVDGKPVPLVDNGYAPVHPEFLPDGIRFRVHADFLSTSPSSTLYVGQTLGHAKTPIEYRVSSGALVQVGPDTFEVAARSGGLTRQGMPWEPWVLAYEPGDASYRSADRPAHILIDVRNKKGDPQTLSFPPVADVHAGAKTIALQAHASSGMPVQFFVESGPAVVEGDHLLLLPIPPRAHYPVRVIVSAYQWGRQGDHPIQTAGPETHEFFIQP